MEIVTVTPKTENADMTAASPPETPFCGISAASVFSETPAKDRRSPERRRARTGAAFTALTVCFTLLLGSLSVFLPKRVFSETENRALAEKPGFSWAIAADGSLFSAWETYFTDHFAGRDAFLRLHALFQTALGKKELNGVYVGKQGHLFLIPAEPDPADLAAKAQAVNAFAAAHGDIRCCFALAPNAISVQSAFLPANVLPPDQKAQIASFYAMLQNVTAADLYTPLAAAADGYLYYLTDHHWTSLGAMTAFGAVAEAMGIDADLTSCARMTAADGFAGTLSGKSGLIPAYDSVELFVPQTDVSYYVLDPATGEKRGTLYDETALSGQNKYAVFLGGNAPLTVIRTTADTGRRLLVFRDSYANAMAQFLYPYFDKIVLADPRYYYEDIGPVLREHGITDALFLYNADTFWSDTSLADALK